MFDILTDLKTLVAKLKDKQYIEAGETALELAKKALDLVKQLKEGKFFAPAPDAETDALLVELEGLTKPVVGADPTDLSLPEVLALVKVVIDLVKWLRKR